MKNLRTLIVGSFALALVVGVGGETTSARAAAAGTREAVELPRLTYPLALLHKGLTSGEVHVLVKIGPDAQLLDTLVTSYTHQALADYTLNALKQARLQPSMAGDRPVTTVAQLTMRFESSGTVAVERHSCDRIEMFPGRVAYEPCEPGRLDRPLQALTVVPPAYPRELGQQGAKGSVVLEYYVDETGRVRMPVVHQTENELLSGLSLAAVAQWQFSPPVSRSKPVLVHVRQRFEFVPEDKG